jgi:hypothetical protein
MVAIVIASDLMYVRQTGLPLLIALLYLGRIACETLANWPV